MKVVAFRLMTIKFQNGVPINYSDARFLSIVKVVKEQPPEFNCSCLSFLFSRGATEWGAPRKAGLSRYSNFRKIISL
jgi:hypothetical protein